MLYTASYFEPNHQHGKLLSISRSIPKNIKVDDSLPLFAPSIDLLASWKAKKIAQVVYIECYRTQIKESWQQVTNLATKKWGSPQQHRPFVVRQE